MQQNHNNNENFRYYQRPLQLYLLLNNKESENLVVYNESTKNLILKATTEFQSSTGFYNIAKELAKNLEFSGENIEDALEIHQTVYKNIKDNQDLSQIEDLVKRNIKIYQSVNFEAIIYYEIIQLINNFQQDYCQDFLQIVKMIECDQILQKYIFDENIAHQQKEIAENILCKHQKIFEDFKQNSETFRYLARMAGGMKVSYEQVRDKETVISEFLPVSLLPMKIKQNQIEDLIEKTQIWQKLINNMASDMDWLETIFSTVQDDFVQSFLKILRSVKSSTKANSYNFTIIRNDFMNQNKSEKWLQVEFNTLSAGLKHISDCVKDFQKTIFPSYLDEYVQGYNYFESNNDDFAGEGFLEAHNLYGVKNARILYVVGEKEWNMFDQRHSEVFLAKNGVRVIRKTFEQLLEQTTVDEEGRLFVENSEISVVYWRWGYSPKHYYSEELWQLREKIEVTKAFKCPNIQLILVNFKKIQLELQNKQIIQKFLTPQESEKIQENFAEIRFFDNQQVSDQIIEECKQNPQDWVLKPQREGGGNNIYNEDIYESLLKMDLEQQQSYILMEKIKPQPRWGYMLTPTEFNIKAVVSELSTWGYFIGDSQKMVKNVKAGYLNRTKYYQEKEGGLSVGLSVLDGIMVKQ